MSPREPLRDSSGRPLGFIERRGERFALLDAQDRLLGIYDPTSDRTFDANNRFVGDGNLLAILLHKTL